METLRYKGFVGSIEAELKDNRQAGFDHDDVRILVNVRRRFAQTFAGVGRIYLIGFVIAESGRALGRIAKRQPERYYADN